MSLGARATKGGAGKGKDRHTQDKGKSDKPQPKEKVKPQATTEQLRMANMIDRKSDDTADVRKMVQDLMEMTCRTEDEVCSALHDADNDVVVACNILLEAEPLQTSEWQTSEKKKKKPPAVTNNGEADPPPEPRSRSGPRPRRGSGERGDTIPRSRGGRGVRGGRGGGRGGARGGRGAPRHRMGRDRDLMPSEHHSDANPMGDTFPATEDWDNEEWSGSLSDTKVFTPSVNPSTNIEGDAAPPRPAEEWEAPDPGAEHIPTYTYHNPAAHHTNIEQQGVAAEFPAQPMGMSGSLSAAQSHYLSQLTQQSQLSHEHLAKHRDNSVYSTTYGVFTSGDLAAQRKPQRARVPPPSKIPVSAVEMPGGGGAETQFLDVQFGAGDDTIEPAKAAPVAAPTAPVPAAAVPVPEAPAPVPAVPSVPRDSRDSPSTDHQPTPSYSTSNHILTESIPSSEPPASSQPPCTEPAGVGVSSSLEKQLSASIKQMSISDTTQHQLQQHRPAKSAVSAGAVNMYSHHPVSHHPPPLYSTNVYPPQVNSSNASLTAGGTLPTAYPSSVVTQYQPIINSYQSTGGGGGGSYNTGPLYPAYPALPQQNKLHHLKDNAQYETNAVASSNSLTSTSTTQQTSTTKVTTTTGHNTGSSSSSAAYGGALYGSQQYAYDDQMLRSTMPHHMGGYYEVTGYGVGGVAAARDGNFSLSANERFSRTDASSPQQVATPTLPPGYAYYAYQPPPPTTYQYGVYPFGAGSNVGGGGKVPSYGQQQQPQYDAQDSYKTVSGGGVAGYGGAGKAAGAPDLSAAIYPKPHVALNKVNSYEKAGFHSGTPPPFGAASHLYIAAPHHHHHAAQHQESASSGGRSNSSKSAHSKPSYSHSYWPPN